MMRACKVLKGGLQDVADDLGVSSAGLTSLDRQSLIHCSQVMRIGPSHQAGSDSLLTASTFFKMRELYFNDTIDDAEYSGKLYGLGQTFTVSNGIASDSVRGSAATIAEREDRSGAAQRAVDNANAAASASGLLGGVGTPNMASALAASSYGPMGANGPYMRTAMGVGGR